MLVVDTHCHTSQYWYEPVETLLDVMSRNNVDKASLIQLGGLYDNAYLVECVRRYPGRFSAVVNIDTDRPDAPQQLEELVRQGAEGIRMGCTARSPGRDPLAIWHTAAELGVVVSVQGSVGDLASPDFENIVRQLPGLTFHIEHLGHGPQDATPPHDTYRRVLDLAQYSNTYMKVPGFNELGLDRARPFALPLPIDKLPPLIDMAMDAFGARRLTWGSNFPHVAEKEGYRNCLQLLMEHVKFKSEEDKEWLCGRTAATLFRFGVPAQA